MGIKAFYSTFFFLIVNSLGSGGQCIINDGLEDRIYVDNYTIINDSHPKTTNFLRALKPPFPADASHVSSGY